MKGRAGESRATGPSGRRALPLGSPSSAVVEALIRRHPEVTRVRIRSFPPKVHIPRRSRKYSIDRALRHVRGPERVVGVSRRRGASAYLRESPETRAEEMVGFCSDLRVRGGAVKHALLMDFRCKRSAKSMRRLLRACRRIGRAGWLLKTSNSYHFYGEELVNAREWERFMGRWLLLEDLCDVRFVGHCIIEGVSCLRFSGTRAWPEPRVVAHVAGRAFAARTRVPARR